MAYYPKHFVSSSREITQLIYPSVRGFMQDGSGNKTGGKTHFNLLVASL